MNDLQIEKIILRQIELSLKHAFETSFGVITKRRAIIVEVIDKDGASGFGECTAMEHPFYNHESVDAAWQVITSSLCPMLSTTKAKSASDVGRIFLPVRGNRMSIAAVETAVWDLEAKRLGIPLWQHLGGTLDSVRCGVSIGIQKSAEALVDKVAEELASGYQRIKIKIKPGHDIDLVRAVRYRFPEIQLSVDANSAYCLSEDLSLMREMDEYDLLMIEQPLEAGDLIDHAKLQSKIKTSICLDESINCLRDARQAIEIGACRIINIKLGRVGGHAAAKEIQEFASANDIPVWCGGMLETGIGRTHNIAMSTLDGFKLPGDISASARYWERDITEQPITVGSDGTITAPRFPGIGYNPDEKEINRLTTKSATLSLM